MERLKWQVDSGGKPCQTIWRVAVLESNTTSRQLDDHDPAASAAGNASALDNDAVSNLEQLVTLELQPLTGRTHQLRVHCAAVGSGIEGDLLYGDCPIDWDGF